MFPDVTDQVERISLIMQDSARLQAGLVAASLIQCLLLTAVFIAIVVCRSRTKEKPP